MRVHLVTYRTLGLCPCAVYMASPLTLEINVSVLHQYTDTQWRFLIAHELGHWHCHTDNEEEADAYALHLIAGTRYRSLKEALAAMRTMHIPAKRQQALYVEALKIDAERGNVRAARELQRITNN